MSDFTVNDTMARIRYELDEREIYNDIRSEIGILINETVVDADPTYSWKHWHRSMLQAPGTTWLRVFTASQPDPTSWGLINVSAHKLDNSPYYDYNVRIESTDDSRTKGVFSENTGSETAVIVYTLRYKYLTAERLTHEMLVPETLRVRATDETSIRQYGRRVMNLVWAEGTAESAMQSVVNFYLTRYKQPIARLRLTVKGITDTLRTQIITREISDILTVICDELDINEDAFINSIAAREVPITGGIPICIWVVEFQRPEELLTLFLTNTSLTNGPHITGS